METLIDVDEAADRLEELVERACAGEQIVISVAGRPVVRMVPPDDDPPPTPSNQAG